MINIIFILTILFLVLIIIFYKNKIKKEQFVSEIYNEPILKKNVIDIKIPNLTIYKNEYDISNKLNNIIRVHRNINIANIKHLSYIEKKPHNLYYTDVYTFNKEYKDHYKALTLCTIPKSLLLVSKSSNLDLTESFLRIGYLNEIDKEIAINLIKSQNNFLSMKNYEFILTNNITEDLFNLNNIDILVYFNTLTNPLFDEIKRNDFNLVPYNNVNKDLFEHYFPFYRRQIFTINKSIDKNIIHNTLQIDTIIFTTKEDIDFNKNYLGILDYFNEFLKINYYLQYFDFTEISKKWSYQKQESIKDVLETFQDDPESQDGSILFVINTEVDSNDILQFKNSEIVSNDDVIVYKVNITMLNNIPINDGDRLLFTYEIGEFEVNKIYYIVEVNEDHIIIENAKKIELTNEVIHTNNDVIELLNETITKYNLEYGDRVYVLNSGLGIIVQKKSEEDVDKLFVLLDEKDETDKLGGEYVNVRIREACVADQLTGGTGAGYIDDIYDAHTTNKRDLYDIENTFNDINVKEWDSRCVEDEECPFYLKNKNYPNTRGGCINGYCEFPIGLKRISYKKYYEVINENNYPRCEGCEDDNIDCCDEQGADHDNFKGPNYIFSRNPDMVT
tara:strand:- start:19921 stop:21771 length:1851 start_codon:yes stop_codon:yes gene_type:complete